jgi:hypothetical protein
LEVGAEEEFKLDLRQDRDPGKQKLKGAVRTETHWCHYCQHSSLFCLLRKGGVVFALASSSWQEEHRGRVGYLANNVGVLSLMMAHPGSKNEDFLFPGVDEGPLQP